MVQAACLRRLSQNTVYEAADFEVLLVSRITPPYLDAFTLPSVALRKGELPADAAIRSLKSQAWVSGITPLRTSPSTRCAFLADSHTLLPPPPNTHTHPDQTPTHISLTHMHWPGHTAIEISCNVSASPPKDGRADSS